MPSSENSRTSGTYNDNPRRVTHLVPALNQNYRTSCGKATRDAVESINQTTIPDDVTCSRCRGTVSYRNRLTSYAKENAMPAPEPIVTTSGPRNVYTDPSCPNCQHLVRLHTERAGCMTTNCLCSSTTPVSESPEPLVAGGPDADQPAPSSGNWSWCVHCGFYHEPGEHKRAMPMPAPRYIREAFEKRQSKLTTVMADYANGATTERDLMEDIQRINGQYITEMYDMWRQGLI